MMVQKSQMLLDCSDVATITTQNRPITEPTLRTSAMRPPIPGPSSRIPPSKRTSAEGRTPTVSPPETLRISHR
ncbi:hypothetical protein NUW54_g9940 [Trametes sanguinea]|uniref:Uncharacterized protein n=1 Tax=Trametes sanguinea TaxID=158606 RepID=A0ACC1P2I8_9APHY|nr:hypothetical protein NUW54_g9940 [Trametes sanguinea]